jgi:orotidine-5'-phosphate decarboxylase
LDGSRIIVALDYPSAEEAVRFVEQVQPAECRLKVGVELFTAAGPSFVERLIKLGFDVFLDLKFHDIPNTVARACDAAARLGVWMLNVHTLGGAHMLAAAREAVEASAIQPKLVGVTLLTSYSQRDVEQVGLHGSLDETVGSLAQLAHDAGLDGVVCSPREAADLRRRFSEKFVLVTPGVRPADADSDDQVRTLTPREALDRGAHYVVVGRPITRAPDPRGALDTINRQIDTD